MTNTNALKSPDSIVYKAILGEQQSYLVIPVWVIPLLGLESKLPDARISFDRTLIYIADGDVNTFFNRYRQVYGQSPRMDSEYTPTSFVSEYERVSVVPTKGRKQDLTDVIFQLLGGIELLKKMIGASEFVFHCADDMLEFRFQMHPKMQLCKIWIKENTKTVEPWFVYRMEFWFIPTEEQMLEGLESDLYMSHDDLYADQLIRIFEQTTGLVITGE